MGKNGPRKPRKTCQWCGFPEDECECSWRDKLIAASSRLVAQSTSET
jgi:hypothetical protein